MSCAKAGVDSFPRPGQWVLPSPAQREMCMHRDAKTFTELCAQEMHFCTSQNHPWSCGFPPSPIRQPQKKPSKSPGMSSTTQPLYWTPHNNRAKWSFGNGGTKKSYTKREFSNTTSREKFPSTTSRKKISLFLSSKRKLVFQYCTTTAGNTQIAGYRHGLIS